KILHEVLTGGLNVDQAWQVRSQPIEVVEAEGHPDTTGNGQQMNHCVGGASDGCVGADCVLEGFASKNPGNAKLLAYHFYDAPAGHLRQGIATRVDRRNSCIAG